MFGTNILHVYRWHNDRFERLLYEKVVLHDEEQASLFLQCYHLRKMRSEFVPQTSTKALYLNCGIRRITMIKILSICRGIENLSLSSEDDDDFHDLTSLFHALETLPLTALCLNFRIALTNSSMVNVNIFARLTHLEVGDADMLQHVDMKAFPMLTHLALWPLFYDPGVNVLGLVKRLLRHATLQVLLFRVERHRDCARFLERHALYDPRIVIAASEIYVWDDFGRGAMLHWELAEERAKLPGPNHSQSFQATAMR